MPKSVPKKKGPGRTKVSTKEKTAVELKMEHDKTRAIREKKNLDQIKFKNKTKVYKDIADKAEMVRQPDAAAVAAKKKSNMISHEKRMAQNGKMRVVKVESDKMMGSFLVDPVPHYIIIQLLCHCYSEEFWNRYNANSRKIDLPKERGGNQRVDAAGDTVPKASGASYYMLNWMISKASMQTNLADHRWEDNPMMSVSGGYAFDSFGVLLSRALMQALNSEQEFRFFPGFVTTRGAAHQELHVDSPLAFQVKVDKASYILHMPLSVEGLTLRVANLDEQVQAQINLPLAGKEITGDLPTSVHVHDFFYHVPFGKALLMPEKQWHGGHYGKENNLRFHAVLQRDMLQTSSLLLLGPVLKNNYPSATITSMLDLKAIDADEVVSLSATKDSKQHTTHYIKKLTELMPGTLFYNCLPGLKKE